MSNGKIDEAQVEALLNAGQPAINRYLVTSMGEMRRVMDDLPDTLAAAVSDAVATCQEHHAGQQAELATLWKERERSRGVRDFWGTLGKILAACCALAGLIATVVALLG